MKIKVKDPIIKRVINKIVGRSNVGFKKYGKTLKDDDTDLVGWLNHLQEELMDAVNYIERARVEIEEEEDAHPQIGLGYGYFSATKDMTVTPGFSTPCSCTMVTNGKCCKDVW
jgi:hypothetical protein